LDPALAAEFESFLAELCKSPSHLVAIKEVSKTLPADVHAKYMENAGYLEDADAHAVYPTSIYRQCDALTLATPDAATIESVMSTTITTTIKIARNVLDPSNSLLFDVYKPLGRCVAVVDDKVDKYFGADLDNYFAVNGIEFTKLVFSGNEVDKGIEDVERILVAMKKYRVGRHEPLLVVGGGVIADIAGFATSLYSRNTPYVMLCTSIVSGIDAGPSPRVCCNGFDYKNLYGSYHPPVLTITDMGFGAYLSFVEGWVSEEEMHRILKTISDCELSLYHPIMDDDAMVWKTHLGIVEKRGGNLCAPIPKPLGFSGYLNDMTQELLAQRMHEYKELVSKYPRGGRGVEELCVDVGLEDPQAKKMEKRAAAELTDGEVRKGQLELLAKLKDEGLLTEEQAKAQGEQLA